MIKKLLLLGVLAVSLASALTITVTPTGAINGEPGSTVGWGFIIDNAGSPNYVAISSVLFLNSNNGSNPYPNFTDYLGPQFFIVGPSPYNDPDSQNFSNTLQTGVGAFTIPGNATIGTLFPGTFQFSYDVFASDPAQGGAPINPSSLIYTVSASVLVAPEPATLAPLGFALAAGLFLMRRRAIRG
jgi:hypothetical protein